MPNFILLTGSNFRGAYTESAKQESTVRMSEASFANFVQRTGLYAGWELEFRLPITAVD